MYICLQVTVDGFLVLVCKEMGGGGAAFLLHSLCCNTVSKIKICYLLSYNEILM